jgi:hypothetical protein
MDDRKRAFDSQWTLRQQADNSDHGKKATCIRGSSHSQRSNPLCISLCCNVSPVHIQPHSMMIRRAPQQHSRSVRKAIAWLGTCLCCALAIVYFYGLLGTATVDPFKDHLDQVITASRTALIATLASSWAIWFGARPRHSLWMAALRTGFATQISLTLYALLGWRSPSFLNVIFPATFFAEYNWLTFILQVAPVTAIASGILSYLTLRSAPPRI